MGEGGDWARQQITDPSFLRILEGLAATCAVDVGCGEGRSCRMIRARGIECIGIDPTRALLDEARRRDPGGTYLLAGAEALPLADACVDLVLSCMSLIDIEDIDRAIPEMARVLRPGGRLVVFNLTSFVTAGGPRGWQRGPDGEKQVFGIDRYLEDWAYEVAFSGLRIINRHRPLSRYMALFLGEGLTLERFEEPLPVTPDDPRTKDYCRAPWIHGMVWRKPGDGPC